MMDLLKMLPTKVRLSLYLLVALGAAVYGAYTVAEGDWLLFVGNLIVTLQGLMAASNVSEPEPVELVVVNETPPTPGADNGPQDDTGDEPNLAELEPIEAEVE